MHFRLESTEDKLSDGKFLFYWFVIIFVSPLVLGLLSAYNKKYEIARNLLKKIKLNPIHDIPTGWDYKFSKAESAEWVLVTLKNGAQVAGLFGDRSFASSESTERDLYIEKVYKLNEDQEWQPISQSTGILIQGEQIKHIEFFTDELEANNG